MGLAPVPVELLNIIEERKENNIQIRQRTEESPPKKSFAASRFMPCGMSNSSTKGRLCD